jgi:hypothetical protein
MVQFQSTPPCEGATWKDKQGQKQESFQSTPPCEGATISLHKAAVVSDVSIHAPVRGGDCAGPLLSKRASFNRARGRRLPGKWLRCYDMGRPRARGGDPSGVEGEEVSIHAPVRGGDRSPALPLTTGQCFNPRPRARGRPLKRSYPGRIVMFQSTPPCEGATFIGRHPAVIGKCFNPRPRARGRLIAGWLPSTTDRNVSIHAPVRGGDRQFLPMVQM